ncbi:scaffold protein CheW associated with MCPs of class 34H [Geotalea daltonii FRC-32]|uniref:Scaffold protein CheW associated with MCPs of class 34H n=1 Tax=Geotalea daltonii (strain DSM 22248 / JCM 15807 / FRC-32) TaxID=316067 RepID=B9M9P9_GEODF|nr:chemotaxis protein CheW [Geotalea daltonii]ACM20621.1 scaffold protein CheW associated with MCPs of class 34H [Geotalea daltonii FRC-32]
MEGSQIEGATQYLTFTLDEEVFALDIGKVREVLDYTTVTKVPQTPDFMRGVINLRGNVVPVVDMRLKFAIDATENTVNTCIIIVEVDVDGEITILGAMADSVQEVLDLEPDQIEPPPRIGARMRTDFIRGMGKRDEQFIMILDIDRIFSGEELAAVQAIDDDISQVSNG